MSETYTFILTEGNDNRRFGATVIAEGDYVTTDNVNYGEVTEVDYLDTGELGVRMADRKGALIVPANRMVELVD